MKVSSRHRPVVGPVALGALALLTPCRVVAQTSSDHEVAVAEFREARRLIDANDCAAALVRLERSLAREPSIGARMSMAECQEKGEPVKACCVGPDLVNGRACCLARDARSSFFATRCDDAGAQLCVGNDECAIAAGEVCVPTTCRDVATGICAPPGGSPPTCPR